MSGELAIWFARGSLLKAVFQSSRAPVRGRESNPEFAL
jgi:hypothetical protein